MSQPEKARTTVDIYGRSYNIVGNEKHEQVRIVASLVDEKMREIHEVNKSLDTTNLAVLTAVNTMNDYIKLKEEFDVLQKLLEEKEE
ncbi:cell division protein ZapA [Gracilibacillus caseinilyticus]|uniref:Cell division protein ZapA n=1 Tax=Gracilibacillus caseinilyticus TaxID=2932256 RepID=A0ABY4F353_9BACI|nr:cell division protein ZapA [Gracilibacillus caseinilyticus]UOQ50607.1 cell division protein ZapA [Gracilibacillus caseinilyticus]